MPLFTNGFIPRSLASISLAMGDPPKTYSAMFTTSAPAKRIQFNRSFIETYRTTEDSTNHFPHLLPPATKLRQGNVFYTCRSVILFTGGWGVSVPACTTGHMTGVSVQGISVWRVSVQGIYLGGLCLGESVQGVSVQEVSVQGGSMSRGVCVQRGSVQGGSLSRRALSSGSLSGGLCPGGVSVPV